MRIRTKIAVETHENPDGEIPAHQPWSLRNRSNCSRQRLVGVRAERVR